MQTDPIRPYGRRSARTYVSVALMLRHRLAALAWLYRNNVRHVTTGTAARVLGVTKSRIQALIRAGKLRVLEDMPGGGPKDRYVLVDDLAAAPTPLESGRARGWHLDHRNGAGDVPSVQYHAKNAEPSKNVGPAHRPRE